MSKRRSQRIHKKTDSFSAQRKESRKSNRRRNYKKQKTNKKQARQNKKQEMFLMNGRE